jgi:hypothetical protein
MFAEGAGKLTEAMEARRYILTRSTGGGDRDVRTWDHKAGSAVIISKKGDAPWPTMST